MSIEPTDSAPRPTEVDMNLLRASSQSEGVDIALYISNLLIELGINLAESNKVASMAVAFAQAQKSYEAAEKIEEGAMLNMAMSIAGSVINIAGSGLSLHQANKAFGKSKAAYDKPGTENLLQNRNKTTNELKGLHDQKSKYLEANPNTNAQTDPRVVSMDSNIKKKEAELNEIDKKLEFDNTKIRRSAEVLGYDTAKVDGMRQIASATNDILTSLGSYFNAQKQSESQILEAEVKLEEAIRQTLIGLKDSFDGLVRKGLETYSSVSAAQNNAIDATIEKIR